MKSVMIALVALLGVVAQAQAVCNDMDETLYQIKNGKVKKLKGVVTSCGNMDHYSQEAYFPNGTIYVEVEREGDGYSLATLNQQKAIFVNRPHNLPKRYQCVKNSTMKNEAYCAPFSQE